MLTPQRWMQVRSIFENALDRAGNDRRQFLHEACAGDPELQSAVERMLANDATGDDLLDHPEQVAARALLAAAPEAIRNFGRYRILGVLGEGGMGTVYEAAQELPRRTVALKVIKPGRASRELIRRFEQEAEALGRLQHPGIAQIYEAGTAPGPYGPQPYFAMELIRGRPLLAYAEAHNLRTRERLELIIKICEAVDHAHQRGIIHRDLKPGNLLVDETGQPKILDFGVARVTDSDIGTACTGAGQLIGTLAYMSPEQVMADPEQLDTRSDVYALGVILYQLLAGKLPYAVERKPLHEAARIIIEEEAPALGSISRSFRGDIETIAAKALEKDKTRRYASAAGLAEDLKRYLQDQPITARPRSVVYRLRKFVRRHKPLMVGLASATTVFALGVLVFVWLRPRPPRAEPWLQLTRLPDAVSQPALSPDGSKLAFIRGRSTFAGAGQVYVKTLPDGEVLQLTHDNLRKMDPVFSPDGARIAYTATPEKGFHWDTWTVPVDGGEPRLWLANASGLSWFTPPMPGRRGLLFSEIQDHDVHMGIVAADENRNGERNVYLPVNVRSMAHRSYASPDGQWALLVEMNPTADWLACRLVPMDGHSLGREVGPPNAGCTAAAWSTDGRWMYFNSAAGGVFHIWRQRFPDGRPEQMTSGPTEEEGIAMASDGRSLITAVGLRQSAVWVYDENGERQVSIEGYCFDPKFTPDGKRLCYRMLKGTDPASDPSELYALELATGRSEPLLPNLRLGAGRMVYDISPDGQQVVAAVLGEAGKPRLWLAPFDHSRMPHPIPGAEGAQTLFEPDGSILFTGSEVPSPLYRLHHDGSGWEKILDEPVRYIGSLSPDGQSLALRLLRPAGVITALYPLNGGAPVEISPIGALVVFLNWSRDGKWIYLMIPDVNMPNGRTYAVPLRAGKLLPEIPERGFQSEAQVAALPGARRVDAYAVAPGPRSDIYAFARETVARNLFRVPVP